ncbi:MAG: peptidoglycan-associated lipoprotein Pal [Nitrospirota bacterium]
MRRIVMVMAVILGIALIAGCSQRKIAQSPEQPLAQQPPSSAVQEREGAGGIGSSPAAESVTERELGRAQQAGPAASVIEIEEALKDIHFDYDKYDIRDDAKPVLKALASRLSKDGTLGVIVEGHCDDRGTGEYNLALGDRRASATRTYLVSLGIPSSRIQTISYGEEKPACSDATEPCWANNRRAHFVLTLPKK